MYWASVGNLLHLLIERELTERELLGAHQKYNTLQAYLAFVSRPTTTHFALGNPFIFHGAVSAFLRLLRSPFLLVLLLTDGVAALIASTDRTEFEYWYPMDLRCSAKDLIPNHLTMALYNHASIWKDRPELW